MVARGTVAIIAERRHLENVSIRTAHRGLEAAGFDVHLVVPGVDRLFEIPVARPAWQAALSRGRDLTGLALLAAVAARGVPTVNTPQSIELVRNKIAMQSVLAQHHLPVPGTWFAADPAVFGDVPAAHFPIVVKPYDGDGATGLWLLTEPGDAAGLPQLREGRSIYLAQSLLETDGWDLKLYGIGSHVWAVRKRSPVRFSGPGAAEVHAVDGGELVDLDARLRDLALTCGRACGLDLWGVDVALTPSGPVIIEVNDFPTFSAVPEAGELIAERVITRMQIDAVLRDAGRSRSMSAVRSAR